MKTTLLGRHDKQTLKRMKKFKEMKLFKAKFSQVGFLIAKVFLSFVILSVGTDTNLDGNKTRYY